MSLQEVELAPLAPARFADVLAAEPLERFEEAIDLGRALMTGRTLWTVNSTARGGGVAEMLRSLIGYVRGAGIDARWLVASASPEFFAITKRLHNRLHGADDGGAIGEPERALYERTCTANAEELTRRLRPADIVLLHDPQTAGMIPRLAAAGVPVIWRAHVGLDLPNDLARVAWRFLMPYVERADAVVFSRPTYAWEGLDAARVTVIAPSIDAFAPKNQTLSFSGVTAVLRAAGLAADHHHVSRAVFERLDGSVGSVRHAAGLIEEHALRLDTPLVVQVSRWDRLKDPLGVLAAFVEHVHLLEEPHLLLAGPDVSAVADDPEGAAVLDEVADAWRALPRSARRRVHLATLPMADADENAVIVNALQRRADVVVQKSLAEGFGLTVAEAMWKGRPVVASAVGGIQDQIEDGRTGYLVAPDDLAAAGARITELLEDPHGAERMGVAAQASVRDGFLGPRHLGQWVELLGRVLAPATSRAPASSTAGSSRPRSTPGTGSARRASGARTPASAAAAARSSAAVPPRRGSGGADSRT